MNSLGLSEEACAQHRSHRPSRRHDRPERSRAERYAFTYADGELRRSGDIPQALDPSRFFGDPADGAEAERPLLEEAVAGEFGVSLPRHALVNGRLRTFTSRSWTREPGDGETYAVIRMEWGTTGPADGGPAGDDGPGSV